MDKKRLLELAGIKLVEAKYPHKEVFEVSFEATRSLTLEEHAEMAEAIQDILQEFHDSTGVEEGTSIEGLVIGNVIQVDPKLVRRASVAVKRRE